VPIGKAAKRRSGNSVTIVGISYMAREAVRAADELAREAISAEVIDLRSVKPWDQDMVLASVRKTGRLVVADSGWHTCGAAAEIAATVSAEAFDYLKAPVARVTLPDAPAPASRVQEQAYFVGAKDIVSAVRKVVNARVHKAIA
jgi:pyruvate dehydrogenase E1 component beta subunit